MRPIPEDSDPSDGGRARPETLHLSPNVAAMGLVSLLMGMSSAMIHGLLPVFLIVVLGASTVSVGVIEGVAEATTSLTKIFSGVVSDWIGRRKPLVVFGYALSAVNKMMFPLAGAPATVLAARVIDRVGKGIRDAPRDALLTDVTPFGIRGSGFGLRLALYTFGAVVGPLAAMGLMALSGDDFRFVFWCALVPALLSVVVLIIAVKEPPNRLADGERRFPIRFGELARLGASFWRVMVLASLLSLARFSPAFLVLKAHAIGVDAAYVPMMLVLMHLVCSAVAYPFGVLADRIDRRMQLALGIIVLVGADLLLAAASSIWLAALGAALWGLQMGMTHGLLAASVADAAPDSLRGTAFGIYDLAVGAATFIASAGAGALWLAGGAAASFGTAAAVACAAVLMLLLTPGPKVGASARTLLRP